jgi:hypothetical protein
LLARKAGLPLAMGMVEAILGVGWVWNDRDVNSND